MTGTTSQQARTKNSCVCGEESICYENNCDMGVVGKPASDSERLYSNDGVMFNVKTTKVDSIEIELSEELVKNVPSEKLPRRGRRRKSALLNSNCNDTGHKPGFWDDDDWDNMSTVSAELESLSTMPQRPSVQSFNLDGESDDDYWTPSTELTSVSTMPRRSSVNAFDVEETYETDDNFDNTVGLSLSNEVTSDTSDEITVTKPEYQARPHEGKVHRRSSLSPSPRYSIAHTNDDNNPTLTPSSQRYHTFPTGDKRRSIFPNLQHDDSSSTLPLHAPTRRHSITHSATIQCMQRRNSVGFSPNVEVHQFHRSSHDGSMSSTSSMWFNRKEMKSFRRDAMIEIAQSKADHQIAKAWVRTSSVEEMVKTDPSSPLHKDRCASVKTVLVVGSHDVILMNIRLTVKKYCPNASTINTAKTSQEVMNLITQQKRQWPLDGEMPQLGYDVIFIDERLQQPSLPRQKQQRRASIGEQMMSVFQEGFQAPPTRMQPITGAQLLQQLASEQKDLKEQRRKSITVGLFGNPRKVEADLKRNGADLVWCKKKFMAFDGALRNELITVL